MNTKIHYGNRFRDEIRKKINNYSGRVFSRSDLTSDRSNREQLRLNRALRAFIDEGFIVKIAHGLFARSEPLKLPNGEIRAVLLEPFEEVAMEALDKLNIQWEPGTAIQEYNEGKTTQVPAVFSVRLKSRYRGSIQANGRRLIFEGVTNSR